jgi:hypothetical protein
VRSASFAKPTLIKPIVSAPHEKTSLACHNCNDPRNTLERRQNFGFCERKAFHPFRNLSAKGRRLTSVCAEIAQYPTQPLSLMQIFSCFQTDVVNCALLRLITRSSRI